MKSYSTGYVTFGGGAKGEIKGVGRLTCTGLPSLDDVLLVKGMTANLISISQLFDQCLKVNFIKSECLVTNENNKVLIRGVRYKDNCFLWTSQEINCSSTCLLSKEDEVKLWNQKLVHLHLKCMKMIVSKEAIRGIPKLKIEEGKICGGCQIGTMARNFKIESLLNFTPLNVLAMSSLLPSPLSKMELLGARI